MTRSEPGQRQAAPAPIRVMAIVARLNIGGLATNLIQSTAALERTGRADVVLVHGMPDAGEGDAHDDADAAGIRRLVVPALGRPVAPLRDLRALWAIWRLIRRHRPDVVHTHASKAGLLGRVAAFLAGVPVRIHTFHGHVLSGYFGSRTSRAYVLLERLAARATTRIVTLSDSLLAELAEDYRVAPRDRFEVIPLGLDLGAFAARRPRPGAVRVALGLGGHDPLIGSVGRVVPVKNLELFVDTARLVHERRRDVQFVVVGDGESRAGLAAAIAAARLEGVVHMVGWEGDVPGVMSDLDVLALTSDNEGTPVSLLEAVVAGVPVVATDVGGVGDVLRPELAEQVVPPRDAPALADAIIRTLEDPPPLAEARRRILATHDIDAAANRHLELYEHLLAERARRA